MRMIRHTNKQDKLEKVMQAVSLSAAAPLTNELQNLMHGAFRCRQNWLLSAVLHALLYGKQSTGGKKTKKKKQRTGLEVSVGGRQRGKTGSTAA